MLTKLATIGRSPGDSHELRIQKSFLVYLAVFMSGGGIVWGSISLYYGLYFQSVFPLSYCVISFFNLLYFRYLGNFGVVRFVQTLISLALPFAFQWSLGGFDSSGSIMLWAILSLIASLTFQSIATSINWLVFYIALTIASAVIDETVQAFKPEILPNDSILFTALNLILISGIVFGLVVYFVHQFKLAETQLEYERDLLRDANRVMQSSYKSLKEAFDEQMDANEKLEQKLEREASKQLLVYEKVLAEQRKVLSDHRADAR